MQNNFYFIGNFSNIYKNPSKRSEVTSQIIHGEKFKILAKDKKLLFYEWHVQKASEKNCNNCWFTSAVSIPVDQGNTI